MAAILGIDPGLTRCGVALLQIPDQKLQFSDVYKSSPQAEVSQRVGGLAALVEEILDQHQVALIALERVFAQANLRSVMGVAQISGAVLAMAHKRDIPVAFFTPTEVKLSVSGSGRASKIEVTKSIERIFPSQLVTRYPDEADAVAVALCAARRGQGQGTAAQQAWIDAARKANRRLG